MRPVARISVTCPTCKQSFAALPCQDRKYCSSKCARLGTWACTTYRAQMRAAHLGCNNWHGRQHRPESIAKQRARFNPVSVQLRSNGYAYLYMPNDERAINGRVAEHVIIMERHVGRRLMPGEVVHHVNRIRSDNQSDNLRLMDKTHHSKLHHFATLLGWSIDKGYFEHAAQAILASRRT